MKKENKGFAKLQGENFEYYLQKLSCTLGRTCNERRSDVFLGNHKNISRLHATIFYNFHTKSFEIYSFSKNGLKVNSKYVKQKETCPLNDGDVVIIGDSYFHFFLPSSPPQKKRRYKRDISANLPSKENTFENELVHKKPNLSYSTMIARALSEQSDKRLTLQEIYKAIMDKYPYFRTAEASGWKSSVRHNLSLKKFFRRVPASEVEEGKRAVYELNVEYEEELVKGLSGRQLSKNIREKEKKKEQSTTHFEIQQNEYTQYQQQQQYIFLQEFPNEEKGDLKKISNLLSTLSPNVNTIP